MLNTPRNPALYETAKGTRICFRLTLDIVCALALNPVVHIASRNFKGQEQVRLTIYHQIDLVTLEKQFHRGPPLLCVRVSLVFVRELA